MEWSQSDSDRSELSTEFQGFSPEEDAPRDKREAFIRLAEKRTNAVLERIRILGNLSNKNVYSFTEEDVDEIFAAIANELEAARNRFASTKRRRPEFRLSAQRSGSDRGQTD